MKLRTQILAFGLAGAILTGLVGGIGLFAATWLGESIDEAILAGAALQSSQEADMMHDAIRGDAQLAYVGALENNKAQIAEAEKGLKDHAGTFAKALDKVRKLPLSAEAREAEAAARPFVTKYIEAAGRVVKASGSDLAAARDALPALQSTFAELEARMAVLSDAIEQNGEALNVHAKASVQQVQLAIAAALLLATATMVVAALWMARRMARPMAHAVDVADRLAQSDLTVEVHAAGNDETVRLLEAMARMQANFSGIVRGVQANAEQVAAASTQIAQGNNDLSQRTERQASALEETAASMEELGSTVRQNADNAEQANQLAQSASSMAIQGGDVVAQVVDTMKGIDDSSKKIADIISVIDGIAFQTNILALNAAVEAARAGEQGRGFAVVASEVRSLAGRSAAAAKEIKSLITASVERVALGTTLVDRARVKMTEVVSSIKRVTDMMGEISAASTEQSAGVSQVGEAVIQMDKTTQQNAALVEESAAAAETLKAQAQQLVQAVAVFKLRHGEAVRHAAAAPAPSGVAVERRGPNRARNVSRPAFSNKTQPATAQDLDYEPAVASAKTGTDDWASF